MSRRGKIGAAGAGIDGANRRAWTEALETTMQRFVQSTSIALALTVSGTAIADAPPRFESAPSAALYARLVEKARNGDSDTNYTALRLSYVQSEGYDPYSTRTRPLFEDTWQALGAKDCASVIAKSNELLRIDFTRIVIHALRSDCFGQLGDAASASRELAIGRACGLSPVQWRRQKSFLRLCRRHFERGGICAARTGRQAGTAIARERQRP